MHPRSSFIPNRFSLVVLSLLALVVLTVIPVQLFAQGNIGVDPSFQIGNLFVDIGSLSVFIIVVTAYVRAHVFPQLDGWGAKAVTFLIGIGLALIGFYMHLLKVGTLYEAVTFGASAALMAMGGVKTVTTIAAKAATVIAPGGTPVPATPPPSDPSIDTKPPSLDFPNNPN